MTAFQTDFSLVDFLEVDLPAMLAGLLAALCCALPGNFLLLRQQSLIGNAITHVVLPGIVLGFILTQSMGTVAMMLGALGAAIIAVVTIEALHKIAKLESGAAMGLVFTTFFALGVFILEKSGTASVHLDVEHALYGSLESTLWLGLNQWSDLLDVKAWRHLPPTLGRLCTVLLFLVALFMAFYKEMKLFSFDPGLAKALGFSTHFLGGLLIVATAVAAVATFDAVGAILPVAMFVCPPASARLLTDRLSRQIFLSLCYASLSALFGYLFAVYLPLLLGWSFSLNAAGMIASCAFFFQLVTLCFAPRYGLMHQAKASVRG